MKTQWHWTPPALADRMATMADVVGHLVLEPSAGKGAIVHACMDAGALLVDCIEQDPELCRALKADGFYTTSADFLSHDPADAILATNYQRIVMNPPFRDGADVLHVEHALKFLAPGGILVSLMSKATGVPFFNTLSFNDFLHFQWYELPEDTFKGRPAILVKITKI